MTRCASDVTEGAILRLTDSEFGAILEDGTKRVIGDLVWEEDVDHSPA